MGTNGPRIDKTKSLSSYLMKDNHAGEAKEDWKRVDLKVRFASAIRSLLILGFKKVPHHIVVDQ